MLANFHITLIFGERHEAVGSLTKIRFRVRAAPTLLRKYSQVELFVINDNGKI